MLLLIDNYDSFTYNLAHYLGELGAPVNVRRNDALDMDAMAALAPRAVVLSPGPSTPDKAGICIELIQKASDDLPILGVCLGHQAIGEAMGGKVVRAPSIMHGKLSAIAHDGAGLFRGIPPRFQATRYHSLVIAPETIPECLIPCAWTEDRAVVMGIRHRTRPVFGVQFHPESIASEYGKRLLGNFLAIAGYNVRPLQA